MAWALWMMVATLFSLIPTLCKDGVDWWFGWGNGAQFVYVVQAAFAFVAAIACMFADAWKEEL
jgi:hypothetical protein